MQVVSTGAVLILVAVVAGYSPQAHGDDGHVRQVKAAMKSAYARTESTSRCTTPVQNDLFEWPKDKIERCTYRKGKLDAVAYLLVIKPERIAQWIETACAEQMPRVSACFSTVLHCAHANSGMMFAISGNLLEDMGGRPFENYFFRNGMTVKIGGEENGTTGQIPMDRQEALALMPNTSINDIPTGVTRLWRTLPKQYALRFSASSAPKDIHATGAPEAWLRIAREEMLAALDSPRNRLLDAYVAAHPQSLRRGACPKKDDSL
jgi:hypothetical protein